MKKNYIYSTLFVGASAIALAGAVVMVAQNHNTLGRAPIIQDFSKPQQKSDDEKLAEQKAAEEAAAQVAYPSAIARKAPVGTELPPIVASVYDYDTNTIGMYQLPTEEGGEFTKLSDVSSYYGGTLYNGVYYACHDGRFEEYWDTSSDPHGHRIQAYNPDSWEKIGDEVYFSTYRASDMAVHPETGMAYAFCDYGSVMYNLYELNLETGASIEHRPASTMFSDDSSRALAFNSEGVLYGVTKSGYFGTVSLEDGRNSKEFYLKLSGDLQHGWTGEFDPDSGNFIFIYNFKGSKGDDPESSYCDHSVVYSVNPNTGDVTELAWFPKKCITSMYIAADPVAAGAPGEATDLETDFPEGSLSGTLTFNMPATLYDGSDASGSASWAVFDAKEQLASGTATYGEAVTVPLTVENGGKHTLSVSVSNDEGVGKKARLVCWIGPDVPSAPAEVAVDYNEEEGTFAVSWSAVDTGVNGGYVNGEDVRYTVTRNPGEVVVAENLDVLSYTDNYTPEGIESVTYSVTASQGDLVSAPAVSDPVVSGSLKLPYSMKAVSDYYKGSDWSVFDENEDGKTWEANYSGMKYTYHNANSADDWMISPPIKVYVGCKYRVKVSAYAQMSSFPERIEVKMGYVATPDGMTEELVEPTVIDALSSDPKVLEFEVAPEQEGKFFIGIHAISDPNQYNLFIEDVTISAPESTEGPAAITGLTVTADPSGELSVTGKGVAPKVTAQGHALPSISSLKVFRDGDVVAELEDVTPGAEFTFTDGNIDSEGVKSYTAIAYNGELNGTECDPVSTFVGVNYPGELFNITVSTENGEVTVNWDEAATDFYGYPLNGEKTYCVEVYPDNAYYHGNVKYENITETTFTFTPQFEDDRDHGFVYVKVNAVNEKGGGYANRSANIPVGTPLTLPFKESFPNYTLEHPWGDGESNGPQVGSISDDERSMSWSQYNGWNRLMDRSFNSAEGSQDGDNGFAGMFGWSYVEDTEGNYHNEWTELLSPYIDLSGADCPMLSFYTYNWLNNNGKDLNELEVYVVEGGERHLEHAMVIGDLGTTQAWEHVAVNLSAYAGKTVYLIFKGTIKAQGDNGYNWILLDNIRIEGVAETDLGVDNFAAPVEAKPGEAFTVSARVTNLGSKDVEAHTVTLYKNDVAVDSKELGALAFSRSEIVEFEHALAVTDPVGNDFVIEVTADGDDNADNNRTAAATVGRNLLLLPEPTNVGIEDGTSNIMAWDAPDMENADPAPFTDDFEDYGDFETSGNFSRVAGQWVFEDVDEFPIGGIVSASTWELIEFPGIPTHSVQSWWVQNRFFEEFNDDYYGHSGFQYLANMYVVNEQFNAAEQQDDWAISPLLCGKEQMISLWARSYDRYTPETVEFLWSDGSVNPEDFTLVRRVENMSGDWTKYVFVVPEGARRFAIRGCSYAEMGTNQTFVDDVTFVPADGEAQQLELLGYNLYKNDVKQNSEPVTDTNFAVDAADLKAYAVSAVYDKGESRAVPVGERNGIEAATAAAVAVATDGGHIVITGLSADSYSVTTPAGVTLASGVADGTVRIPAQTGVYVVTAAKLTVKVVVK